VTIPLERKMTPFNELVNDEAKILDENGETLVDALPCIFEDSHIITFQVMVKYKNGQTILRKLPNGLFEQYVITKVSFKKGLMGHIPDSFELHFQDTGREPAEVKTIVNNISGQNARVNINSTDNSKNQYNIGTEDVFEKLPKLLKEIQNLSDRKELQRLTIEMQKSQGTPSFLNSYKEFMSLAANHVSILAPVLPVLAAFL